MLDQICLPKNLSSLARDLIKGILERDPNLRMEIEDIKRHKFFKGINWVDVSEKLVTPFFANSNAKKSSPRKSFKESCEKIKVKSHVLGDYNLKKINDVFANF